MFSIKRSSLQFAWQIALAGLFITFQALDAQSTAAAPTCSNASVNGPFVLCENGRNQQSPSPYCAGATRKMDGAGNITGTERIAARGFSPTETTV